MEYVVLCQDGIGGLDAKARHPFLRSRTPFSYESSPLNHASGMAWGSLPPDTKCCVVVRKSPPPLSLHRHSHCHFRCSPPGLGLRCTCVSPSSITTKSRFLERLAWAGACPTPYTEDLPAGQKRSTLLGNGCNAAYVVECPVLFFTARQDQAGIMSSDCPSSRELRYLVWSIAPYSVLRIRLDAVHVLRTNACVGEFSFFRLLIGEGGAAVSGPPALACGPLFVDSVARDRGRATKTRRLEKNTQQ